MAQTEDDVRGKRIRAVIYGLIAILILVIIFFPTEIKPRLDLMRVQEITNLEDAEAFYVAAEEGSRIKSLALRRMLELIDHQLLAALAYERYFLGTELEQEFIEKWEAMSEAALGKVASLQSIKLAYHFSLIGSPIEQRALDRWKEAFVDRLESAGDISSMEEIHEHIPGGDDMYALFEEKLRELTEQRLTELTDADGAYKLYHELWFNEEVQGLVPDKWLGLVEETDEAKDMYFAFIDRPVVALKAMALWRKFFLADFEQFKENRDMQEVLPLAPDPATVEMVLKEWLKSANTEEELTTLLRKAPADSEVVGPALDKLASLMEEE